jgi:hypothetical protein
MSKHLDHYPSTMACEPFGYESSAVFSKTSRNKGQSFMDCSPRPRGQGGRHGFRAPVTPARVIRAEPRKTLLDLLCLIMRYANVIQLQTGLSRCRQGQLPLFLPGCRESALRASRATVWAPLQAAGGRATAVKLQTDREFQCMRYSP